jgi:hypothetical protein
MRALGSALSLGGRAGTRVELLWYRDSSLNCDFKALFTQPEGLSRVIVVDLTSIWGRWFRKILVFARSHGGRGLYDQDFIAKARQACLPLDQIFSGKKVFIETSSSFFEPMNYGDFTPVKEIEELIALTSVQLDNAVGIHIRRSDNTLSIKHSPTEKFEEVMRGMLASGYCERFFLSTDSAEVERYMIDKFNDQLVIHPKRTCDRNVDDSIKDAVVDLYCLASCKKIVGSYWSSFSETAALIGNKELVVVDVLAGASAHTYTESF